MGLIPRSSQAVDGSQVVPEMQSGIQPIQAL